MPTVPTVLIVDDEPDLIELVSLTLGRMNLKTASAGDLAGARARLAEQRFDLCLTDMRLPDGDGLDLVAYIQEHHPTTPVAVITAHGSVKDALLALAKLEMQTGPTVRAYKRYILAAFSNAVQELADFGLEPPKARKPKTSEQSAAAAAKAKATRAKRATKATTGTRKRATKKKVEEKEEKEEKQVAKNESKGVETAGS